MICRYCGDPVLRIWKFWFHRPAFRWHMHEAQPYSSQKVRR